MPSEEADILKDLYERVTRSGYENVHNVMAFWKKLDDYRDSLLQGSEEYVTPDEANSMLLHFKYYELWYELTWEQKQNKNWSQQSSIINNILHNKAGWTHAAKSIMQYGLPKLERRELPVDSIQRTADLVQLAKEIALWLKDFARSMHEYKQTDEYQKNLRSSMQAMQKRQTKR